MPRDRLIASIAHARTAELPPAAVAVGDDIVLASPEWVNSLSLRTSATELPAHGVFDRQQILDASLWQVGLPRRILLANDSEPTAPSLVEVAGLARRAGVFDHRSGTTLELAGRGIRRGRRRRAPRLAGCRGSRALQESARSRSSCLPEARALPVSRYSRVLQPTSRSTAIASTLRTRTARCACMRAPPRPTPWSASLGWRCRRELPAHCLPSARGDRAFLPAHECRLSARSTRIAAATIAIRRQGDASRSGGCTAAPRDDRRPRLAAARRTRCGPRAGVRRPRAFADRVRVCAQDQRAGHRQLCERERARREPRRGLRRAQRSGPSTSTTASPKGRSRSVDRSDAAGGRNRPHGAARSWPGRKARPLGGRRLGARHRHARVRRGRAGARVRARLPRRARQGVGPIDRQLRRHEAASRAAPRRGSRSPTRRATSSSATFRSTWTRSPRRSANAPARGSARLGSLRGRNQLPAARPTNRSSSSFSPAARGPAS